MPTSKNEEVSFMDAVSTLLKCLKSKRFINDIEKAKAEVSTERIKLRTMNEQIPKNIQTFL